MIENSSSSGHTDIYKKASQVDPYQQQKANIQETFWDKVSHAITGRSSYDKQMQDLDLQSALRHDQLRMLEDEAKYNSESEKVARMKEAGLNPDLQGISSASETGEYNEPQTTPMSSDYQSSESQLADSFKGMIDLGLGLFKGFQDVRGLMIDNSIKATQRYKSLKDLASSIVDNSLLPPSLQVLEKDSESGKDVWTTLSGNNLDYDAIVKQYGSDRVRYGVPEFYIPDVGFLRGRDRKAFDAELNRYKRSIFADGKKYKSYYDYLTSRKQSALASSSPFADPSYRQLEDLFRPISQLMFDVNKASLELEKVGIENEKSYEGKFDPETAAESDNARNASHQSLEEYNKQVNDAWHTASDAISQFGKKNPVLGMIGMVLLNWLRSNMPMPSIPSSHHTDVYNNNQYNSNTEQNFDKMVNINN